MLLESSLKAIFNALDERCFVELENGLRALDCAAAAFTKLQHEAQKEGFSLDAASAFRSFSWQADIIEEKFTGKRTVLDANEHPIDILALPKEQRLEKICVFSSLPGLSRHHLGTDFDVYSKTLLPTGCSLKLEISEYQKDGYFALLTEFLDNNLKSFGFYRPYEGGGSIAFEPWHISFKTGAEPILKSFSFPAWKNSIKSLNYEFAPFAMAADRDFAKSLLAFDS